jgi:hypothetical protein
MKRFLALGILLLLASCSLFSAREETPEPKLTVVPAPTVEAVPGPSSEARKAYLNDIGLGDVQEYIDMSNEEFIALKYIYENLDSSNNAISDGYDILSKNYTPRSLWNLYEYLQDKSEGFQEKVLGMKNSPLAMSESGTYMLIPSSRISGYWAASLLHAVTYHAKLDNIKVLNNIEYDDQYVLDRDKEYSDNKNSVSLIVQDEYDLLKTDTSGLVERQKNIQDFRNMIVENEVGKDTPVNIIVLSHMDQRNNQLIFFQYSSGNRKGADEIFTSDVLETLKGRHVNVILASCTNEFAINIQSIFEGYNSGLSYQEKISYLVLYPETVIWIHKDGTASLAFSPLTDIGDSLLISYLSRAGYWPPGVTFFEIYYLAHSGSIKDVSPLSFKEFYSPADDAASEQYETSQYYYLTMPQLEISYPSLKESAIENNLDEEEIYLELGLTSYFETEDTYDGITGVIFMPGIIVDPQTREATGQLDSEMFLTDPEIQKIHQDIVDESTNLFTDKIPGPGLPAGDSIAFENQKTTIRETLLEVTRGLADFPFLGLGMEKIKEE